MIDDGYRIALIVDRPPRRHREPAAIPHAGHRAQEDIKIIVAKGVHSLRPAMKPIAKKLIWVATPGVTTADLMTFTYRHRRVPLFPLERDARP